MPKLQEFTGQIISKETYKVYKKNEFYGNINYKLTIIKENKEKLTLFAYANLVSQQIFQVIEKSQYVNQQYHFFCERRNKSLVLHNWEEINNHEKT